MLPDESSTRTIWIASPVPDCAGGSGKHRLGCENQGDKKQDQNTG